MAPTDGAANKKMEKVNNTLQELANTLGLISIKAGPKKESCRELIQLLDTQVMEFITAAVEEELGDPDHRERDIFPSADVRTAEFEEDIRLRKEYPESLFPMAADVLCRQVSEWFRRELLLHVKTTQLSRTLLVEVSGLLSGPHTSLSDTPVTAREEYEKQVEELQRQGWGYNQHYGSLEIVDCPANLENIHKVIAQLGGKMPSIQLLDGCVRSFSFRIPSDKCSELFQTMSGKPDLEEKPAGDTVTEDDVAVIQRNLKDLRFALSNINLMADRSIILSLLRSYTANIEDIFGFSDMACAKAIQAQHAEEAKKNRNLRERQEEMGRDALFSLDLRAAYDKIETGLQKVFYPLGLRVDDLHAFSYATTRFSAIPRVCYKDLELRPGLEIVQEPDDRMVYLRNTPQNIDQLVAIVRETMPDAKLESLEVAVREFGQIIKKVQFMISPADIAKMLDVTKSMEEVSDF